MRTCRRSKKVPRLRRAPGLKGRPSPLPLSHPGERFPALRLRSIMLAVTTEQRHFARRLRRQATGPEDILWSLLRNRRLAGLKFRRQVPLLGYTLDFVCIDCRLIVEVDGRQHGWEAGYDAERTAEIERFGFTVIRFRNAEIIDDRDAVLAAIRKAAGG